MIFTISGTVRGPSPSVWTICRSRSSRWSMYSWIFPALASIDRPIFPTMEDIRGVFAHIEIHALPIPHDCSDGFLGAYWRRPHAYLDPGVRGAMSTFTKLATLEPGLTHLRRDLEDGSWERRHLHLLAKSELDLGYRLVIATIAGRRLPDDKTRPPRAKF